MRFSAITALCAAPLALAVTLQADLIARDVVGREAGLSVGPSGGESVVNAGVKGSGDTSNGGHEIIQESSSVTEVIIIWFNNGGGAATQTVTTTKTVTAQGTAVVNGGTTVATHSVTVGGSAGLVYTPDSIEAAVGDMVVFTFLEQNHTVTQSAFTTPCDVLAGGMDSGFMPNPNSSIVPAPQMAMQVTVATPLWFFCAQKGHCGKGMTFSINPTVNKTQAMFQQMAIAQNGTGSTAVIAGGVATSSTVSVAAPAVTSSSSASTASMVSGTGSTQSGSCQCSCLCGVESFPSAAQGISAFGGVGGAMPMAALMAK